MAAYHAIVLVADGPCCRGTMVASEISMPCSSVQTLSLSLVLGWLTLMGGCAAPSGDSPAQAFTEPGRSVVLDSVLLAEQQPAGPRWFDERNDYHLTTYDGVRGPRFEQSYQRVQDFQSHTAGRVRDHYWSRTTSQSVTHTVR